MGKIKDFILKNKLVSALVAVCVVYWGIMIGGLIIENNSSSDGDYKTNSNYASPSEDYYSGNKNNSSSKNNSSKVKCGRLVRKMDLFIVLEKMILVIIEHIAPTIFIVTSVINL